ncbi:MAG: cyclic nucleotide-binding domain-containing protein [Gallionella sp.]|nr:cyclic nucleotide-binding domain-containing protein [Gallionella sp.]
MTSEKFKIVIVGSGPGGLSAAARAAEHGISHLLLEAAPQLANTIHHFQKGKSVMAEPSVLPLRSSISFGAGIREHILNTWHNELGGLGVNFRVSSAVTAITGEAGAFEITLASGVSVSAEFVVLAIGVQGNIRKLAVPGEDLPGVQYHLDDPEAFRDETIVVVGGGDAGVENALALSAQNRVILINRQEEFSNCKEANFDQLMVAISQGKIETRVSTLTERIEASNTGNFKLSYLAQTPEGHEQIECHRVIARLGAKPPRQLVESFGVAFPNSDSTSVPQLTEQYESNLPGLYIVGALAGYPLIKQAMNQGYEVIEYILGNPVEPADEALLKQKFSGVPDIHSVSEGIALLRINQPLLAPLTTLQLREFMLDSSVRIPSRGEIIFSRNDYSNSFFSILEGRVAVQTEDQNGNEAVFALGAGNFFGEMGLLSGRRRSGTVVASENCILVETPRRSMLKLLYSAAGVQRKLDEVSLKRAVSGCLDTSLPESELSYLVQGAQPRRYAVGDVLFSEGDKADGLYMIRRGSVTVSRIVAGKEVVLAYVSAGNYVGEMALMSSQPRSATVRAASPTEVVLLESVRVAEVLGRNTSMRRKVDSRYLEQVRSDEHALSSESSELINFLMGQGVGEATDVLLIDYARCIRCNNCETSCADAHDGTSRLDREAGSTFAQIHVPTSCRHCEHPHCMKDCPPDAIHRSVNGEVFISDNCIGCGNCQTNCPYGVIQMAIKQDYQKRSIWQVMLGLNPAAKPAAADAPELPKIAVKCDMCKDIIGGPVCVRACPTGAAFRVSPENFMEYVK